MIEIDSDGIKKMRLRTGSNLFISLAETEFRITASSGIVSVKKVSEADAVLLFADSTAGLKSSFGKILKFLKEETVLWIAYPKKSSGIETDLSRDHGWNPLTENDYEGVALISLNDIWSALRFKKSETVKRGGSKAEKQKRPELSKFINYGKKTVNLPEDVRKAFSKNKSAGKNFDLLSWSHKREFIESVLEAKTPKTRENRILKMLADLSSIRVKSKK
ncbi:YdeI/OmpD-associated family protein [Leptospira ellisii]|uniref:Bacteriocin-protection protein n=1 Tax=Leptospira ellisii TaxID=2023197 RepID=A0A2N0BNP0_9LEPT|nr:YdeI/OmpD-associated family protein [Leptospira ellisii]MDV6234243.1 YdeI/OmpD-associated family protein [Leptospira ellisii]PJZ94734.1 bacteriocin-protection protein [Leptospira ellisii]PKA05591.1 bacteriocin-protection protein [Leptospira ellisii]